MRSAAALALLLLAQDPKPEDVVPMKPGSSWTYLVKDEAFTVKVAGREKVGEIDCSVLETTVGGRVQKDYFALTPGGLVSYKVVAADREIVQDPPVLRVKFPLKRGDSWEWKGQAAAPGSAVTFANDGEEEIAVPAGRFKAWKITSTVELDGGTSSSAYWYAPGTGLVRQDTSILLGGQLKKISSELKSYEAGK